MLKGCGAQRWTLELDEQEESFQMMEPKVKEARSSRHDLFRMTRLCSYVSVWVHPYVLRELKIACLGSHKRRDNRCGIAAPILEKGAYNANYLCEKEPGKSPFAFLAITAVLESRGWEVHTEVEIDPSIQPLEDRNGDKDTLEAELLQQIRESEGHHDGNGGGKRALLVKVSHIGGHKFAGNIIVYSPKGTGVWYGRVFPEKVSINGSFELQSGNRAALLCVACIL